MNGMAYVGRGKLGGTTSSSLLKLRMLLGAKSGYSGHMQTSGRSNRVSRLSCIKHRENGVSLSRRNGSHGIKKCVNYFKLRHDICICIFVCMTKYNQISCNLNEIPLVLVKGAQLLQWYY